MEDIRSLIRRGAFKFEFEEGGDVVVSPFFQEGIQLIGLPGSGKTDIVRWLGHATGLPVYEMMANARGDGTVNSSATTMRATIEEAKANGPCILFIDEYDKLVEDNGGRDNGDKKGMVAELQKAQAGELRKAGVMVVLAMNKPPSDSALLRAGRVSKKYYVGAFRTIAQRAEVCNTLLKRNLNAHN